MIPKAFPLTGLRSYLSDFFKKFPQHSQFNTRRPKDITDLIKEFHKDLIQEVIDNRYGVILPLRVGLLRIVSFKKKRYYPNFTRYGSTGVTTGFSNNHTDGLSCKIVYSNKNYKLKDKILWSFVPEVPFKKKVSKAFEKNYNRYIFSPDTKLVDKRVSDFKWRDLTDETIKEFMYGYNEFEIN